MEPLKSNQISLQVDMTPGQSTQQAVKKIKSPKFVPYEPTRAFTGPDRSLDRTPTDCSIFMDESFDSSPRTPTQSDFADKKLYRYPKTVYVGKKSPENDLPKAVTIDPSIPLSPVLDKLKPINVVDPIRHDHVSEHVVTELAEEHVVGYEESYTESRAVAHLQAVNEACNQKIIQLRDERMELKKELELQFQINAELKKLLVASMGDEMHHDVEMLVRQRTQLSSEIENYCRKIQDNQEALDKMNIMADMWRSKYIASRVMVDELAGWKAQVTHGLHETRNALSSLLNERLNIRQYIANALRYLQQIHSALTTSRQPRVTSSNLVDLAKHACHLAENVKFRFLGNVPMTTQEVEGNEMTSAERLATEVLGDDAPTKVLSHSASLEHGPSPRGQSTVARFHPDTRYELLTINCCTHCKGEISVV